MSVSPPAAPPFKKTVAAVLRSLLEDFSGSYHPERHYMRGPGPKWREKYLAPRAAGYDAPAAQTLLQARA